MELIYRLHLQRCRTARGLPFFSPRCLPLFLYFGDSAKKTSGLRKPATVSRLPISSRLARTDNCNLRSGSAANLLDLCKVLVSSLTKLVRRRRSCLINSFASLLLRLQSSYFSICDHWTSLSSNLRIDTVYRDWQFPIVTVSLCDMAIWTRLSHPILPHSYMRRFAITLCNAL